jgi:hypothetical protein
VCADPTGLSYAVGVRRLGTVVLAGLGWGCSTTSAAVKPEAAAPKIWVEGVPTIEPDNRVDSSAWSGVWTEYFPGRIICQDRFTLRAQGPTIAVESIDCRNDQSYAISQVRWDGQTLQFVAEQPGGGFELRYEVALDGPEQISGTANDTEITWSRTD